MTALLRLAARLATAGGRFRIVAVALGTGLATLVLLAAAALPGAVATDPADPSRAQSLAAAIAFLVAPVGVLLLVVTRVSSLTRDRRLASLRLLGLSTSAARGLAAGESVLLTLPGVAAGLAAAVLLGGWADRAVQRVGGWLDEPLRLSPLQAGAVAATVVGVVGVVAASAAAGAVRGRDDPRSARAEASAREPSPWRLTLLLPPVLLLGLLVLGLGRPGLALAYVNAGVLIVGAVTGAVAVALVAPVLTAVLARRLVARGGVVGTLAGRTLEVEPASAARLVAGLSVAVYLVVAAFGVLAAVESTPQYLLAAQTVGAGPQKVRVVAGTDADSRAMTDSEVAALRAVPGVRDVVADDLTDLDCFDDPSGCVQVISGTCAQLAELVVATGCRDDQAARLEWDDDETGWGPGPTTAVTALTVVRGDDPEGPTVSLTLGTEPVVQDVAATTARWVYPTNATVFVPSALVESTLGPAHRVTVVADGGTEVARRIVAASSAAGMEAWTYPTDDDAFGRRVRALVVGLAAVVLGIGLFTLTLGTLDRALERRRPVTRLVAVGVAPRTLRAASTLQVLLPLVSGLVLALGLGLLLLYAWFGLADDPGDITVRIGGTLGAFVAAAAAAAGISAAATWPTVVSRVSPSALRQE